MTERQTIGQKSQAFFEDLWKHGDPWDLQKSPFEQAKYRHQLEMLQGRRYARALEIGCGAGYFTRSVSSIADSVVALDISPVAIARAHETTMMGGTVEFRVANVMDYDPRTEGPWDLVVFCETIYYLGWLYSFFDIGWLAYQLFEATQENGHLLMANTCGGVEDHLLSPWIIRTYRDLFLNVGYHLEAEEIFRGTKNSTDLEVLISVFGKSAKGTPREFAARGAR